MKKNCISISALAVGILLAMNGCGGGSGSTEKNTPSEVSGVAVDDLILNGIVTATDASGNKELAKSRTSATDGTYTLHINHDGVVLLNVQCDENSTMWNPTSSESKSCEEDLLLHTVADVSPGIAQTVNISPITEIVYQRALALSSDGNVDKKDFEQARNEMGVIFRVESIAADPQQGTYAAIIEAIHTVAKENNTSVMEVTEDLATALEDGVADGEDVIMDLIDALNDANVTIPLTVNDGNMEVPENPAALSDVDAAKALFEELRTQAMSVVDYQYSGTPGFLDNEAENMNHTVNTITMEVETIEEILTYMLWDIEYMMEENLTEYEIYQSTTPGVWTYSFTDANKDHTYSGTISIPASLDDTTNETILYDDFGTLKAEFEGTLPLYLDSIYDDMEMEEGVENLQRFRGAIEVTKTTAGANVSISGSIASNGTSLEVKEANAEVAYSKGEADGEGGFEPKFEYFKLQNVSVQGVAGEYTIDGEIVVNNYVQNEILAQDGSKEEDCSEDDFSNSGWLPSDVTFTGAVSREGASINGMIKAQWMNAATLDPDSEAYVPQGKVSIEGRLQMPERPEMIIALSFENSATNNILTASYSYDATLINMRAVSDTEMNHIDVEITTSIGQRADIAIKKDQPVTGRLTKDGRLVGTFEEREGVPVIKYIDGTFESLP